MIHINIETKKSFQLTASLFFSEVKNKTIAIFQCTDKLPITIKVSKLNATFDI